MTLQEIVSFAATFVGLLATLSVFLPKVHNGALRIFKAWLGVGKLQAQADRMEIQLAEVLKLLKDTERLR